MENLATDKKIVLIIGKSGSGKSTIINKICNNGLSPNTNYKQLDSYTTRPKRTENEKGHIFVNTMDYTFTTRNNQTYIINKKGEEIKVMAYTFFNNNHYWGDLEQVQDSDFYIIDRDGIDYFKTKAEEYGIEYRIVYIDVPFFTMLKRLIKRDGLIKGISRLINDFKMFKGLKYDYRVVNDDLNKAVSEVKYITDVFMKKWW